MFCRVGSLPTETVKFAINDVDGKVCDGAREPTLLVICKEFIGVGISYARVSPLLRLRQLAVHCYHGLKHC
jgi:hypothetical protein